MAVPISNKGKRKVEVLTVNYEILNPISIKIKKAA